MTQLQSFNRGFYQRVQNKWIDSDKDSPIWQFVTLIVKPNSVFKHVVTHKHETGFWIRGNLKFLFTEIVLLMISIIFWFIFRVIPFSFNTFFRGMLSFLIIDFGIICSIVSTIFWKCLNKWRIVTHSYRESRQDVEWKYCADAFHNCMVAIIFDFIYCFPIVSVLSKLSKSSPLFSYFIPNSLLCISFCHGIYLMISSFNVLAFVKRMNPLYFIVPVLILFSIFFALRFDFVSYWISFHFQC